MSCLTALRAWWLILRMRRRLRRLSPELQEQFVKQLLRGKR